LATLAITGDIGGLKALLPVIEELSSDVIVVDRGDILQMLKITISSVSESDAKELILDKRVDSVIWTTSVTDTLPLTYARLAKENGIKVFCLLDNWMNYKMRLGIDGLPPMIPDHYLLMDQLALDEALRDGLPLECLTVSGQPALSDVGNIEIEDDLKIKILEQLGSKKDRKLISFISEPAEKDQGADKSNPNFRGYTEKTVLADFLNSLQKYSDLLTIAILPHPRESKDGLVETWEKHKGKISGGILEGHSSNQVVSVSDAVSGMASILLYESWLQAKPVISIQPNLLKEDLATLEKREGVLFVRSQKDIDSYIKSWIEQILLPADNQNHIGKNSLDLHKKAAKFIAKLVRNDK